MFNEPKFSCPLFQDEATFFILFMKLLSIAFKSLKFLKFSENISMSINFKRKV